MISKLLVACSICAGLAFNGAESQNSQHRSRARSHSTFCSDFNGKLCRLKPCNFLDDHPTGPQAQCSKGFCRCPSGTCAYAEKCIQPSSSACDKHTAGTCRVFSCFKTRGWTDCNQGLCECQRDACAIDGECYKSCEYRTAGTCNILPCRAERNATCEGPGIDPYWGPHGHRCVCPRGRCSQAGLCFQGKHVQNAALKADWPAMPDLENVLRFALFVGFVGFSGIAIMVVKHVIQHRSVWLPESPLG